MKCTASLSRILLVTLLMVYSLGSHAADQAAPKPLETTITHADATQAKALVDQKKVIVLDIRTPAEFKTGHISGATNIDFRAKDFAERVGTLDKSKTYLVHCAVGGRSTACLPVLKKQSFTSIVHLDGGLNAWEKAGLPVEK